MQYQHVIIIVLGFYVYSAVYTLLQINTQHTSDYYRYWYWVLVSLEANIIGYWVACLALF